jgi:hypothetical protein
LAQIKLFTFDDADKVTENRRRSLWATTSAGALCEEKANLGIAASKPTQPPSWIGAGIIKHIVRRRDRPSKDMQESSNYLSFIKIEKQLHPKD